MKVERYEDLPEAIYETFDEMTDRAYELFVNKKYDDSFQLYEKCLEIIPEPKRDYADGGLRVFER